MSFQACFQRASVLFTFVVSIHVLLFPFSFASPICVGARSTPSVDASLSSLAQAAPHVPAQSNGPKGFTPYSGPASNFPRKSEWKSFQEIFMINEAIILGTGDTMQDMERIWGALIGGASGGIDNRVIFAIILQESTGNVGVQTTVDPAGRSTAGLMQCEGCPGFPGQHNLPQV